jgi:starch synthase
VHYDENDTARFEGELAAAVNDLLATPGRAEEMGRAGRARAERVFAWPAIAQRTVDIYRAVHPPTMSRAS